MTVLQLFPVCLTYSPTLYPILFHKLKCQVRCCHHFTFFTFQSLQRNHWSKLNQAWYRGYLDGLQHFVWFLLHMEIKQLLYCQLYFWLAEILNLLNSETTYSAGIDNRKKCPFIWPSSLDDHIRGLQFFVISLTNIFIKDGEWHDEI